MAGQERDTLYPHPRELWPLYGAPELPIWVTLPQESRSGERKGIVGGGPWQDGPPPSLMTNISCPSLRTRFLQCAACRSRNRLWPSTLIWCRNGQTLHRGRTLVPRLASWSSCAAHTCDILVCDARTAQCYATLTFSRGRQPEVRPTILLCPHVARVVAPAEPRPGCGRPGCGDCDLIHHLACGRRSVQGRRAAAAASIQPAGGPGSKARAPGGQAATPWGRCAA